MMKMTKKMSDLFEVAKVREVVAVFSHGNGFWINEEDFSEWFEDIDECPDADREAKLITWDGRGDLTIEI